MEEVKIIGIIGQGFVGTAIREKMKDNFDVIAYDTKWKAPKLFVKDYEPKESCNIENLRDIVKESDVIFVCVPTPMYENGECDLRIVESVIEDIAKEAEFIDKYTALILKSTVPPGTVEHLNSISSKVTVNFSPEFLTEANSIEDFKNQNRIVLGIDYAECIDPIYDMFKVAFPEADIIVINSKEAEMTKYVTNLFLATKVSFFNDIYNICGYYGIDYNNVIEATMHDPRIGKSHYTVPGPDGDFGYGGHCFPKDMSAILFITTKDSVIIPTIVGAATTNAIVRKNKDWEKMEGRAVSKRSNQ